MSTSEQTAAAEEGAEEQETASGSETTEEIAFPTFETEVPPEVLALLEEDDEDLTVTDEELDALTVEHEDVPREVLARMRAAEKRAEHLEKLRVQEARKNWAEEAGRYFPLAEPFLVEINATSRRGFLSTAKQLHERMLPLVEEKVLKPAREAAAAAKQEATTEARAEVKEAWGESLTQGAPSDAQVTFQRSEDRRRRGDLSDTIRNMMFPKETK